MTSSKGPKPTTIMTSPTKTQLSKTCQYFNRISKTFRTLHGMNSDLTLSLGILWWCQRASILQEKWRTRDHKSNSYCTFCDTFDVYKWDNEWILCNNICHAKDCWRKIDIKTQGCQVAGKMSDSNSDFSKISDCRLRTFQHFQLQILNSKWMKFACQDLCSN